MVQNNLTPDNIYDNAKEMDFPDSSISYFEGMMGQPMGGFPEELRKLVLKGKETIYVRPGELLPSEDFNQIKLHLDSVHNFNADIKDILSYALYPKVFEDYIEYIK